MDQGIRIRSGHSCEAAPSFALLPFPDHAYSIYQLVVDTRMPLGAELRRAADWVILAAGLDRVVINTNGLNSDDAYCSNIYEETRGLAASAVATSMTKLLFVWGAVDATLDGVLRGKASGGRVRRMCELVESEPHLRHHDCTARNLMKAMETVPDSRFSAELKKATGLKAGHVGQATFAAYQLRNALAHGALSWPDDDSRASRPSEIVGELAARTMLLAFQKIVLSTVPAQAEMELWTDEDQEPRRVSVRDQLQMAHVQH